MAVLDWIFGSDLRFGVDLGLPLPVLRPGRFKVFGSGGVHVLLEKGVPSGATRVLAAPPIVDPQGDWNHMVGSKSKLPRIISIDRDGHRSIDRALDRKIRCHSWLLTVTACGSHLPAITAHGCRMK